MTGFHILNYVTTRNFDQVLIGKMLGDAPLGYYERARRILLQPTRQLTPVTTPVIIPALSRLTDSPEKYRFAFRSAASCVAWAGTLAVGLLACTSEPLILFYPRWREVATGHSDFPGMHSKCLECDDRRVWRVGLCVHRTCRPPTQMGDSECRSDDSDNCIRSAIRRVLRRARHQYRQSGDAADRVLHLLRGTPIRMRDVGAVLWRPLLVATLATVASHLVLAAVMPELHTFGSTRIANGSLSGDFFWASFHHCRCVGRVKGNRPPRQKLLNTTFFSSFITSICPLPRRAPLSLRNRQRYVVDQRR